MSHSYHHLRDQHAKARVRVVNTRAAFFDAETELDACRQELSAALTAYSCILKHPGLASFNLHALHAAQARWGAAEDALVSSTVHHAKTKDEFGAAQATLDGITALLEQHQEHWRAGEDEQQRRDSSNGSNETSDNDNGPSGRYYPAPSWAPQDPTRISTRQIAQWHSHCTKAFQDKSTLRSFPAPPAEPCMNPSCHAEIRTLVACKCNIRKLFYSRATLKTDRLQFHPDKFSGVPEEEARGEVQRAAKEVFVVVEAMYQGQ
ncbi:hypothetical protein LTR53_017185 [Teratosphaeriaceae sp. CCFEE 6253]|nr:hypothetical protein LTR53_017185 [Teratosphaeriaceae sp. CCFEE 6253]